MARFKNVWDLVKQLTGSVYGQPLYPSGPETGATVYDEPSQKFFQASQGAPARHANYVFREQGELVIQAMQHTSMKFRGQGTWAPTCGAASPTNDGFLIGGATTVTFTRDAVLSHGFPVMTPSVSLFGLVHDDGFHLVGAENNAGGEAHFASASTVSSTGAFPSINYPFTAVTVGTATLLVGTSGTGMFGYTWENFGVVTPTVSSVSVTGTLNSSSTSIWGSAQSTATGILFSKGPVTNQYLMTNGASCTAQSWVAPPADTLADIAYDEEQGAFVACFYPAGGGILEFATSTDGVTWTNSLTASGPTSVPVPATPAVGSVAFKIASGVWLAAFVGAVSGRVYGLSGDAAKKVFSFYSLDYGQSWYPADLDMAACSSSSTLRVYANEVQFMVLHDSDVSVSKPLGIPNGL